MVPPRVKVKPKVLFGVSLVFGASGNPLSGLDVRFVKFCLRTKSNGDYPESSRRKNIGKQRGSKHANEDANRMSWTDPRNLS